MPAEYFNPLWTGTLHRRLLSSTKTTLPPHVKKDRELSLQAYSESLMRARTGPNGVCGLKFANVGHFRLFVRTGCLDTVLGACSSGKVSVVFVQRKDEAAQAVSKLFASRTGRWYAFDDATASPGEYSAPAIARAVRQIRSHNNAWRGELSLLTCVAGEVMEVAYEDIVRDSASGTVADITSRILSEAGMAGSAVAGRSVIDEDRVPAALCRQDDPGKQLWLTRFRREEADVAGGESSLGVDSRKRARVVRKRAPIPLCDAVDAARFPAVMLEQEEVVSVAESDDVSGRPVSVSAVAGAVSGTVAGVVSGAVAEMVAGVVADGDFKEAGDDADRHEVVVPADSSDGGIDTRLRQSLAGHCMELRSCDVQGRENELANLVTQYAKAEAQMSLVARITVDDLLAAHAVLLQGLVGSARADPGHLRTGMACTAFTTFPAPALLEEGLSKFVEGLGILMAREDLTPAAQAGWALYHVLSLHPFRDGNGRMGRLLVNWVLRSRGVQVRREGEKEEEKKSEPTL
jgi:LPS sulfotransferase NodH/fido (protein-threonine AMPylation protein)